MKYKFIPHTADIQFKAFGSTLEELFVNCALAFSNSMTDDIIREKKYVNISISGSDYENLLYNFLEELLVLFDSENFILSKIKKIHIDGKNLKAELSGDDSSNYNFHIDVKAITYNEMKVLKSKNKWESIVTLDV